MRNTALMLAASAALTAAAGPAAPAAAPAPDPLAVANQNYRVVYEDERIRVLEHTLPVGALEPLHRHPCRLAYAMSGFKTVSQRPGAPRDEAIRQPRTAWWTGAEEHTVKNNGNAVARELITEFKQPLPGVAECSTVGTLSVLAIPPAGLAWSTDPATKVARAAVFGARGAEGPFAERVRMPAGFRLAAHAHDRELSGTILAGEMRFRFGDGPVQVLPAGSFVRIPAGVVHEEWTEAGAEMEVRGVGPVTTSP